MSTVAQVVDRILRDWLHAPDDQPTRFTLNGALAAGATSLTYDDDLLTPEEEDLLGPGTLIEVGSEQILVGSVNEDTNVLSGLIRGANGTTDADHADAALVTLAPAWARKTIFDAVADAIEQLWPELYTTTTSGALTLSSTQYTEVPAVVQGVLYLWVRPSGGDQYEKWHAPLLENFPPSSTTKAIWPGFSGSGYLVYKAKPTRPTLETDSMATLGVEDEWEQLVVVSAVAYLISGKDLSAATQEFLSDNLNAQGYPVDSSRRIREGLLRYQGYLIDKAKRTLRHRHDTPVTNLSAF